jgi:hypothetical protein
MQQTFGRLMKGERAALIDVVGPVGEEQTPSFVEVFGYSALVIFRSHPSNQHVR